MLRNDRQCTLERPICDRCKKSGLACIGYDVHVFVNTTATSTGVAVTRSDFEVTLRHSFNLAAYEEQYLGLFWDIYLPGASPPAIGSWGSWVTVARDISSNNDAVRKALLAVCMILVGQNDAKPWMAHESLKLYTSALDNVRNSLSYTSTWYSDATLVASRALSAYEVRSLSTYT